MGHSNGLDADTVDGKHASDFAAAGHEHDATYVNEGQLNSITTSMIATNAITADKIQDTTVTAVKLSLARNEILFGPNVAITETRDEHPAATPGMLLVSFPNLPPGTYMFYGVASCYVDPGADQTGAIQFDIDDGAGFLARGVSTFLFDGSALGVVFGRQSAGFMKVLTLNTTTTVNLSAFKMDGLTTAVASGYTYFGYVQIH